MMEWRIPLLNARTIRTLHFGRRLAVRGATKAELQRWSNDEFVRDVVPHRVLPEIRSVLVCRDERIGGEAQVEVEQDLMVWFATATLYSRRSDPIDSAFFEEWSRKLPSRVDGGARLRNTVGFFPFSVPVAGAAHWQGHFDLEVVRQPVIFALRRFRSRHAYAANFRFALSRWFQSLNKRRRSLEDAVIDLSIAVESLFIMNDEREGVAKALRERIAAYWVDAAKNPSKRAIGIIKSKVAEAYEIRSRIAHGTLVGQNDLQKAHGFFDGVLREVLGDFISGTLRGFNPLKYWKAPAEKDCLGRACIGIHCQIRTI